MNHPLMRLWRRLCSPLMVTFALLPAPLLLTAYCAPDFLPLVWLWPVGYFLMDVCSTFVRGKWRILYGIAEIAAMVAPALLIGDRALQIWVYGIPFLYAAVLLIALPLSFDGRNEQTYLLRYEVIGVLLHLAAQLLHFYSAGKLMALDLIQPWLLGGFFGFICLGLLMLNQAALPQASGSRLRITGTMKLKNTLLTVVFLGITLALALIPSVVTAVRAFFHWLPTAANGLITLLAKLISTRPKGGQEEGGSDIGIGDFEGNHSDQTGVDETLATVIVLAMVGAAVAVLVYLLVRATIRLAKHLRKKLQKYLSAVSEDYIDEITDTRDDGENGIPGQKTKPKKLSKSELRKLTPEQQIRHRYKQLMQTHPQWHSGSTARENLNSAAASVYEQARYSDHPVELSDAQRFADETKTV